jgi:hypothetical protein
LAQTIWRVATRFHDWSNLRYPAAFVDFAARAGVLSDATWVRTSMGGQQRAVTVNGPALGEQLMARITDRGKVLFLAAGGNGWSLFLLIPPMAPATKRVNGISAIELEFNRPTLEDAAGSNALYNAFRGTHSATNTEYAGIHPAADWEKLRGTAYNPAVTYDPMFAGAAWANFLGPGHVEQFDRTALANVNAEWVEGGVFFRDEAPLGEAATPAAEGRLLAVTDLFRRAREG